MPRYTANRTQRTRQQLSREAMKRAHRRCDLIRSLTDSEPENQLPAPINQHFVTNPAAPGEKS